jgi:perosamine synthetase
VIPTLREVPPTAGLPLNWADLFGPVPGEDFEGALAAFLGARSIGLACSGTAALILLLDTLTRRSGRRSVIVPAYTCPLVAVAIAQAGCKVRLCDTKPDRFDFDPDSLVRACDRDTLAIVPTHLGGIPADLSLVIEAARHCGAVVIEDAAQALGATSHDRPVGTIGEAGIFSLSRGKGLTLYEGGFWVCRDAALGTAVTATSGQMLRQRIAIEIARVLQLFGYALLYNPRGLFVAYGVPLRRSLARSDLLAAVGDRPRSRIPLHGVGAWRQRVGARAIRRLGATISANADRGRARASELSRIPGVNVVGELPDTRGTWPFLMVVLSSREKRDRVLDRLWASGLGVTRLFLSDLGGYDYLRGIVPLTPTPNARGLAERSLTISNSEYLPDDGFRRIHEALSDCLQ